MPWPQGTYLADIWSDTPQGKMEQELRDSVFVGFLGVKVRMAG